MDNQVPARDDVDARTVFIRDLPFSLTDGQLEEVFSEVGPVRHSFTVKDKGSEQNRGFGFVQFALAEDASRAVEAKNGISLQGRKMKVELAKRRPPLDQRRPLKLRDEEAEKDSKPQKNDVASGTEQDATLVKKKRKGTEAEERASDGSKDSFKQSTKKQKSESPAPALLNLLQKFKRPREEGKSSDKQRPARTVVVGGLVSPEMKDVVLNQVKKVESIESQPSSMTEHELSSCGLAKDGCRPNAISIVLKSVRGARKVVAALHQQKIAGSLVWARQLGGEGAKLKKWRLIVRNLPFTVREDVLRELFAPAGFIWEVTIPRKADGNARGFAFVGFTSKSDAEKAISMLNMKTVQKRPIAVDWAVAKKNYETIVQAGDLAQSSNAVKEQEKGTAKELIDMNEDTASEDEDEQEVLLKAEEGKKKKKTKFPAAVPEDCTVEEFPDASKTRTINLDQSSEVDLVRKIMDKIVSSNTDAALADHVNMLEDCNDEFSVEKSEQVNSNKKANVLSDKDDGALTRTVFVRNLPLDVKVPEMKKLFSVFGEVQTFRLVYDKKSNNPKGTAFLEFATADAANAAVAASKEGQQEGKCGIDVKGHSLVLTIAVDRNSVKDIPKPDKSGAPHANGFDSIDKTVFIRNLPTDVNILEMREKFSVFGEVKSARLVLHPITKRPKGTAFLEFGSVEAAKAADAAAKSIGKDGTGGIKLGGRAVKVDIAVGQQAARDISTKLSNEETGDRRNRHLAQEGVIVEGTPAAEGVSKADLQKRQELMHEKATKLRSPNFHVSRTRLSVHNVPKTSSETDLRHLFLKAVLSRASKQKPVIKQVKILKDVTKAGGAKSRGTAFVEFTEHQHALVALRVLNNNPEVFGSEHRPIVEFAIENMKILEKRAKREAAAKDRQTNREGSKILKPPMQEHKVGSVEGDRRSENGTGREVGKKRKRAGQEKGNVEGGDRKFEHGTTQNDDTVREVGKKRKRAGQRKGNVGEGYRKFDEEKQRDTAAREGGQKGKKKPGLRLASPGQERSRDADENPAKLGGDRRKQKKKPANSIPEGAAEYAGTTSKKIVKTFKAEKFAKEDHAGRPSKKPRFEQNGQPSQDPVVKQLSRRERKQKKQGTKRGEDRVDQLVTEYRHKYLSDGPGQKRAEGKSKLVDDIRRWFE